MADCFDLWHAATHKAAWLSCNATNRSFIRACRQGNLAAVKSLLGQGADAFLQAISAAIKHGHLLCVQYLIDTSKLCVEDLSQLLFEACRVSHHQMVKAIQNCVTPNQTLNVYISALLRALRTGDLPTVRTMIETYKFPVGHHYDMLQCACGSHNSDLVNWWVQKHGADFDYDNVTVGLKICATHKHWEAVERLERLFPKIIVPHHRMVQACIAAAKNQKKQFVERWYAKQWIGESTYKHAQSFYSDPAEYINRYPDHKIDSGWLRDAIWGGQEATVGYLLPKCQFQPHRMYHIASEAPSHTQVRLCELFRALTFTYREPVSGFPYYDDVDRASFLSDTIDTIAGKTGNIELFRWCTLQPEFAMCPLKCEWIDNALDNRFYPLVRLLFFHYHDRSEGPAVIKTLFSVTLPNFRSIVLLCLELGMNNDWVKQAGFPGTFKHLVKCRLSEQQYLARVLVLVRLPTLLIRCVICPYLNYI
jgi:hypothetical protein